MARPLTTISSTVTLFSFLIILRCASPANNNDSTDNAQTSSSSDSVYEALEQYNFPMGLLPKGAKGYNLNQSSGEFSAYLNGSCSFKLENSYELKYKPVIKGVISRGRIQKLSGVGVKVLVVWLNIVEIKRVSDQDLEFSVGFTSAHFPVNNFEDCPQCGCGLDCDQATNNNFLLFASS